MKYKFGIWGHFDFDETGTGGQSIKTREFYYTLCEKIGKENISLLESSEYKKNFILFLAKMLKSLFSCERIIIFPAQKGIIIFAPICAIFRKLINIYVYYNVIGGWLPELIKKKRWLKVCLSKFDGIFVETNRMKFDLESQNLKNVYRLLNTKRLERIDFLEIKTLEEPIRLCYFSRIIKQKGIEDAIAVVKKINEQKVQCILDIYGPVVDAYRPEFEMLKSHFTGEIHYCGKIDPSKSVQILKNYDLQIFPTLYKTEGIPGSIIDSYFAGVPVIASKWDSFSDVILEGRTGIVFELGDRNDLYEKLKELLTNKDKIYEMKKECLKEALVYLPDNVMDRMFEIMGLVE